MKVLMVIPANKLKNGELSYSGLIKNEIEGLLKENIEVTRSFLTCRYSLFNITRFTHGVRVSLINSQPDLIHIQTGTAAFFTLLLRSKIPKVLTIGGSDLLGNPAQGPVWKFRGFIAGLVTKISSKSADKIICVSLNLKQALPPSLQRKVVIIPRGIDIDFFKPFPLSEARQRLNWDHETDYIVLSLSQKDDGVKNLPLAKSVIEYYSNKFHSKIRLELILNKTKKEVACMLNAANVLLVTSIHEGSPNIVKEAMACNLPVVAVNCGDVKERLRKVTPSIVTETYEVQEIALALRSVLSTKTRSNGRSILLNQGLDRDSTTRRLIEIYDSCIK